MTRRAPMHDTREIDEAEAEQAYARAVARVDELQAEMPHAYADRETARSGAEARIAHMRLESLKNEISFAMLDRDAAEGALKRVRDAVERERAVLLRERRQAAIEGYVNALAEASDAWEELVALGPVAGLGPGVASPQGLV